MTLKKSVAAIFLAAVWLAPIGDGRPTVAAINAVGSAIALAGPDSTLAPVADPVTRPAKSSEIFADDPVPVPVPTPTPTPGPAPTPVPTPTPTPTPTPAPILVPIPDPVSITLQALDIGGLTILEPTSETPKPYWTLIPPDPGFLVIDDGKRAVFSPVPTARNTWWVVLSFYRDGDERTQQVITTVSRGVGPAPPVPFPPDIPTPVPPVPVTPGAKWVVIIHETSERSAMLAQAIVGLRAGPNAKYLADKSHKLTIIDDDSVDADGRPAQLPTVWKPFWADPAAPLKLPVLLIAEKDSKPTKIVYRGELAPGATADEIIGLVKKAGG